MQTYCYNWKKHEYNLVSRSDIEAHDATFTKWEAAVDC